MKKTRTAKTFLILLISIGTVAEAAMRPGNADVLTAGDSLLLNRYLEGVKHTFLYSQDHQLYLDSVLSLLPHDAYYWQQKAMPLYKQKKYETGSAYLDSAVKYDVRQQYLQYRGFMKCVFQKTYKAAIADFEEAKKVQGFSFVMDHSYDFYMGLCYLQLDQFEKADSLIQSSIAWSETNNNRGHYLEYFYLGIARMEKKKDSIAIGCFDAALKIYPQFPDAQYYKAVCLNHLGRTEEAKTILAKGLEAISKGYGNNEDNSIYEEYPYQRRKYSYEQMAKRWNGDKK